MKRIYILTLTALLVIQGIGIGLAAGEEKATPGLSQFLDSTTNTSSSQHSILDEESMDYDPEDEQETGSDVTNDDSQLEPATEKTSSEVVPETPEHLSGPMNADLRDRLNADVADPSPTAPTNPADDADVQPDMEEDHELPVSTETSVDTSTGDLADSKIERRELEVNPEKNQKSTAPSATEPVKPDTKESEVVSNSETPHGNEQEYTPVQEEKTEQVSEQKNYQVNTPESVQSKTATSAQKPTESSKSVVPAQEASPRNDSGESDDAESTETAQVSRADELAKQNGILPKMSFLFKEFGKWLGELIGSVESIF